MFEECAGRGVQDPAPSTRSTTPPTYTHAHNPTLAVDDPVEARILLRSGAFEGLRDNVRAVGQYAEQAGVPGAAALVPDFFKAVQALDFELFSAIRAQAPVGPDTDARRVDAVAALDRLLDTVPDDVLATARKVVDVAAGGRVVEGGAAAATGGAGSGAGVDDLLPRVE